MVLAIVTLSARSLNSVERAANWYGGLLRGERRGEYCGQVEKKGCSVAANCWIRQLECIQFVWSARENLGPIAGARMTSARSEQSPRVHWLTQIDTSLPPVPVPRIQLQVHHRSARSMRPFQLETQIPCVRWQQSVPVKTYQRDNNQEFLPSSFRPRYDMWN